MKLFKRDKKGVSPVIGVILMVAITVILAAVIASFVFGMGSKVKSAPQAQFMLEDHPDSLTGDPTKGILTATLYGGEDLRCSDIRLQIVDVANAKTYTLEWNSSGNNFEYKVGNTIELKVNGTYTNNNNIIKVGDTLTAWDTGKDLNITSGTTVEFRVIHIPTSTVIYDGKVFVN